jgi:hypothetical protein
MQNRPNDFIKRAMCRTARFEAKLIESAPVEIEENTQENTLQQSNEPEAEIEMQI